MCCENCTKKEGLLEDDMSKGNQNINQLINFTNNKSNIFLENEKIESLDSVSNERTTFSNNNILTNQNKNIQNNIFDFSKIIFHLFNKINSQIQSEIDNLISSIPIEIKSSNNSLNKSILSLITPIELYKEYTRITYSPSIENAILNHPLEEVYNNKIEAIFNLNQIKIIVYIKNENDISNTLNKNSLLNNIQSIYVGTYINNMKHGVGVLKSNSIAYYGYWENDQFTGNNLIIDSEGTILTGNFYNYFLDGQGKRIKTNNNYSIVYVGGFYNNLRDGTGKETTPDYVYEGDFKLDKPTGKANIKYTKGKIYIGEVKDGKFHGKGTLKKSNGEEYNGEFVNGKIEGKGLFKYLNNEYYEGEFKNGVKEGYGSMHWKDGKSFTGNFFNNKPNGFGTFNDGKGFNGTVKFENGKLITNKNKSKHTITNNID